MKANRAALYHNVQDSSGWLEEDGSTSVNWSEHDKKRKDKLGKLEKELEKINSARGRTLVHPHEKYNDILYEIKQPTDILNKRKVNIKEDALYY